MNILGNIGPSTGGPYQINKNGLLKTLRMTIVMALGTSAGYLITAWAGFDFVSGTNIDEMLFSMLGVPLLELLRRWATDYSSN